MDPHGINRKKNNFQLSNLTLKLFIAAINIFALYLITENKTLQQIALWLTIISFAIVFYSVINRNSKKLGFSKRFKGSKLDILRINRKFLHINKKYLLISIIGLSLAILIISQTVLLTSIFRKQDLENFLSETDNRALTIEYTVQDQDDYLQTLNQITTKLGETLVKYDLNLDSISTNARLNFEIAIDNEINETFGRFIPSYFVSTTYWNEDILNFLQSLPSFNLTLNNDPTDALFILPVEGLNDSNFIESQSVDIIIGPSFKEIGDNSSFAFLKYNFSRIWQPTNVDLDFISKNQLWDLSQFIWGGLIVQEQEMWNIQNSISTQDQGRPADPFGEINLVTVKNDVFIEFPDFADIEIQEMQSNLRKIVFEINSWLSNQFSSPTKFRYFYVGSPLLIAITQYQNDLGDTATILLLITGPLVGLAIVFVFFALRLIEERRKRIIATMKTRGMSNEQLFSIFVSELVLISIFSISVGMILSIPWTTFSLNRSSIFADSINSFAIPASWFWKIPLFGIIFALNVNLISFQRMLNTRFEDVEEILEIEIPFWQKYNIDTLLFLIGLGYWLVLPKFKKDLFSSELKVLGPYILIILIFSTPLVLARYFSSFVGNFLAMIFQNKGGLMKLVSRNLRKQKFSTSQLAGFLLLGIMLTNVSHIVPTTYVDWGEEKNRYDLGSDIYVKGIDSSNFTVWNYFQNITGIEAYTEVTKYSTFSDNFQLNSIDPKQNDVGDQFFPSGFTFLGIQPENFSSAAYWKDSYSSGSISELVSSIKKNNSIAIQTEYLSQLGLKIGDQYRYFYDWDEKGPIGETLEITNDFYLFPNLVSTLPNDQPSYGYEDDYSGSISTPILAHIDMVKLIGKNQGYETGAYVKVKPTANITKVASEIKEMFNFNSSISVTSIDELQANFDQSSETKVVVTILEGMQIITIIMVIIALAYFSFVNLNERKREIGIYRSLGMIRRQVAFILTTEFMIIISVGLIFGLLFGQLVSISFFSLITSSASGGTVPPAKILIPWDRFKLLFGGISLAGIAFAVISAFIATSKETGNILRED